MTNKADTPTGTDTPSERAQWLYVQLRKLARDRGDPDQRALTATASDLAKRTGCAYSLTVRYLRELEDVGWIARRQHKHQPTEITLLVSGSAVATEKSQQQTQRQHHARVPGGQAQAGGETAKATPSGTPAAGCSWQVSPSDSDLQSSKFRVQSSEFKVQSSFSGKAASDQSTNKDKYVHAAACSEMNFELCGGESSDSDAASEAAGAAQQNADLSRLFEVAATFRQRLRQLLREYNIRGRKAEDLFEQICKLVSDALDPGRYEQVLTSVWRGFEQGRKRKAAGKAVSAEAVGIRIVLDYVETGQLTLFELDDQGVLRARAAGQQATTPTTAAAEDEAAKIAGSLDF